MYKLAPTYLPFGVTTPIQKIIYRLLDNACIPFDPENTDYAKFKADLAKGAELQDAEGNVMSSADIQTFLAGLK